MFKVFFSLCLVTATVAVSNRQHLKLCTDANLSGDCGHFQNDEADLQTSTEGNFDNIVKSVQLTGAWLFYEFPNYNDRREGWVEIYWGKSKSVILPYEDELSSFRHVGDIENMNFPSVTGYLKEMFKGGSETFTHLMVPNVNGMNINSLIITGQYSWTFYSGNYYSGESVCLTPMYGQPVLMINIEQELGFRINSIKMGCHANEQRKLTQVSQNLKSPVSKTARIPDEQPNNKQL